MAGGVRNAVSAGKRLSGELSLLPFTMRERSRRNCRRGESCIVEKGRFAEMTQELMEARSLQIP